MAEVDLLTQYYLAQAGSGMGDFYSGPIYQQRGNGVGSFLSGLFRSVLPILKRGTMAVGREFLNSGSNFINDMENNVDPRAALKTRSREAYQNLKRKAMYGEGYKAAKKPKKIQLGVKPRTAHTKRKTVKKPAKKKTSTLKQRVKDIFSNVK